MLFTGIAYGTSLTCFYYLWYKDESRSSFHWINDNKTWLQLDKFGHVTTTYTFSEYAYNAFIWTGMNNTKAALYGSLVGLGSMTTVEIFDGYYSKWGASWGDLLANTFGAVLFTTQQIIWEQQKIRLKFSYTPPISMQSIIQRYLVIHLHRELLMIIILKYFGLVLIFHQ